MLGDDGCPSDPVHAHPKSNDKKQVQRHIDHAGHEQEIQGPSGIPDCPQYGCAEVIDHQHRHTQEVNPHIEHGLVQHIIRRSHQMEQGPGCNPSQDYQEKPA